MKKLYSEEIIDCKQGLKVVNFFILFFFFAFNIKAQIPINGFCKYQNFEIENGNKRVFTLNFNGDAYTDLILFGGSSKTVSIFQGDVKGSFNFTRNTKLPFDITQFQALRNRNKTISAYVYLSRNTRRAGIASVAANGIVRINSEIKFKSFPENISTADVNRNGVEEVLISGSAFEGLSLLSRNGDKLIEEKISKTGSFSQALFIDLTNNKSPDIAAFNIINNRLVFYYNNTSGNFREARSIQLGNTINSLISFDLNLDSYQDLIFSDASSITIMYGDSASSYKKKSVINTRYTPHKTIVGDFNRSGKIDIAYIDTVKSLLSVIFSKEEKDFYPETVYIYNEGIIDLVPFYSRFTNGILVLNKNGIHTITQVASFNDDLTIKLGKYPTSISFFDYSNNGINDIFYVDSVTTTLNFILRDNAGIPATFFSIPLFKYNTEIFVDDKDPMLKMFYSFSYNQRLVEIISVDFSRFTVSREQIYTPAGIVDFKISREPNEQRAHIYISYIKDKNLGISIFSYKNFRYIAAHYPELAADVVDAKISLRNDLSLFYWHTGESKLILSEIVFEQRTNQKKANELYSTTKWDGFTVASIANDLIGIEKDIMLSFLFNEEKKNVILTGKDFNYIINTKGLPEKGNFKSLDLLFDERINSVGSLFLYYPAYGNIYRLNFLRAGREIIASRKVTAGKINRFTIGSLSYRKNHIVYTDKKHRSIVIKEL